MNQSPRQRRHAASQEQQPGDPLAPKNVIGGLVQQSRNRYQQFGEMITLLGQMMHNIERGAQQLELDCSQMAVTMVSPDGTQVDPNLHRLASSLQASLRGLDITMRDIGAIRQHLNQHLGVERAVQGDFHRWLRGQMPTMPVGPQPPGAIPLAGQQAPQLGAGAPPAAVDVSPAGTSEQQAAVAGYFRRAPDGTFEPQAPGAAAAQVPQPQQPQATMPGIAAIPPGMIPPGMMPMQPQMMPQQQPMMQPMPWPGMAPQQMQQMPMMQPGMVPPGYQQPMQQMQPPWPQQPMMQPMPWPGMGPQPGMVPVYPPNYDLSRMPNNQLPVQQVPTQQPMQGPPPAMGQFQPVQQPPMATGVAQVGPQVAPAPEHANGTPPQPVVAVPPQPAPSNSQQSS
jgi:hypothetical protein